MRESQEAQLTRDGMANGRFPSRSQTDANAGKVMCSEVEATREQVLKRLVHMVQNGILLMRYTVNRVRMEGTSMTGDTRMLPFQI